MQVATGRILRFDDDRGFGFIAPDAGSEDVFVHANDLLDEKSAFKPGTAVEFEIEEGNRGLKAVDVRAVGGRRPSGSGGGSGFSVELTETLLERMPELTGGQVLRIRQLVADVARDQGVSL
ncbi:cold shock domain-containing protein [Kutzneria viridogrisea]